MQMKHKYSQDDPSLFKDDRYEWTACIKAHCFGLFGEEKEKPKLD
jgi:hypothetical protein